MGINGEERELSADPRTTLLDALRNHLGLTGSKKGCDHGQCGACTVMVNGRRINSCLTPACMHDGDEITTVEGLGQPGNLSPLQAAVRQLLMRRPFTMTVQAPHWPWSQPFLEPVRPRWFRSASRSVVRGSAESSRSSPLMPM